MEPICICCRQTTCVKSNEHSQAYASYDCSYSRVRTLAAPMVVQLDIQAGIARTVRGPMYGFMPIVLDWSSRADRESFDPASSFSGVAVFLPHILYCDLALQSELYNVRGCSRWPRCIAPAQTCCSKRTRQRSRSRPHTYTSPALSLLSSRIASEEEKATRYSVFGRFAPGLTKS